MALHAFFAKGALIFFAIISGMFGGVQLPSYPSHVENQATSTSTSTLNALSGGGTGFFTPSWFGIGSVSSSSIPFPFPLPRPVAPATTTPNYSSVPPAVIVPPVVVQTPTPPKGTVEVLPTQPTIVDADIADVRKAIVNILCTSKKTGLKSISGSGFIIDSRGLILTAAHVGQFFLLDDVDMSCVIRMGDPAHTLYKAKPVYVSQGWIGSNSHAIVESMATGNGKNDYAILAITASATAASLPASFPHLSLGSVVPSTGDDIIIGTYGAEFLTSDQIRNALSPTLVESTIKKTYTLQSTPVDLISLGASDAAQSGSSGGVVVDDGKVAGVVTTSSLGADRSTRDLRAITIGHIRKSFEKETGGSLDLELQASIFSLLQKFQAVEATLRATLYEVIN